ncbi:MAG: hypothetical protein CMJ65_11760 [Planctomycetaceae bacterium]|jgi:hypothetical protein|nr:hypothetical protein [Planctomycetaceae bacterium]
MNCRLSRCLVCLAIATAGCHVGNFSASIDSNTLLPRVEFSAVPEQWEPEIENSTADGEKTAPTAAAG